MHLLLKRHASDAYRLAAETSSETEDQALGSWDQNVNRRWIYNCSILSLFCSPTAVISYTFYVHMRVELLLKTIKRHVWSLREWFCSWSRGHAACLQCMSWRWDRWCCRWTLPASSRAVCQSRALPGRHRFAYPEPRSSSRCARNIHCRQHDVLMRPRTVFPVALWRSKKYVRDGKYFKIVVFLCITAPEKQCDTDE